MFDYLLVKEGSIIREMSHKISKKRKNKKWAKELKVSWSRKAHKSRKVEQTLKASDLF